MRDGWSLRVGVNSRARHYFVKGVSVCARKWTDQHFQVFDKPTGMCCPDCKKFWNVERLRCPPR